MSRENALDIAGLIRDARKSAGLTLEQLAAISGVSRSMLSAIERNAANPTFAVVWSLAAALKLDLSALDGGRDTAPVIEHVHNQSAPTRLTADGLCQIAMLNPKNANLPVEWHKLSLKTGGVLQSRAHARGTMEHLTCFTGALSVTIGENTVSAGSGDTLRYRADTEHTITNEAKGISEAVLLVVQPKV
ncbi:helix-turn-helix domain-containing protein [Litoreibacter roseus]|uniref:DNA-binding protein n=1 Tax=Litoreibacter roseus TaxID=2601869 RepID=A0A6N6JID1_9RHOB|nr:XRE family transcriptional regulator [Litoreibacter roseus]GFE66101.1 DNA-binding protein [Litoreibacter roseus]